MDFMEKKLNQVYETSVKQQAILDELILRSNNSNMDERDQRIISSLEHVINEKIASLCADMENRFDLISERNEEQKDWGNVLSRSISRTQSQLDQHNLGPSNSFEIAGQPEVNNQQRNFAPQNNSLLTRKDDLSKESRPTHTYSEYILSWFIIGIQTLLIPIAYILSLCDRTKKTKKSKKLSASEKSSDVKPNLSLANSKITSSLNAPQLIQQFIPKNSVMKPPPSPKPNLRANNGNSASQFPAFLKK
jgi:hypothetical protein